MTLQIPSRLARTDQRSGVAAVEFAIVAPLLFMLVLGMLEFGRMMMVQQILTNGAREGARAAVLAGSTDTEVRQTIDRYMTSVGVSGHTSGISPSPAGAVAGAPIKVSISVPYNSVSWLPLGTLRHLRDKKLTASVVMQKE